jgi:hypothetical protein
VRLRLAPWTRRQQPELVAAIVAEPGAEIVNVRRADRWSDGWVCDLYLPRPWPDRPVLVAKGSGRTALGAFEDALAVRETT